MAIRFTCFFSYPHIDDAELMRNFVEKLSEALQESLKLYLGKTDFFVDMKRLKPGYIFDETIAAALCQSLCLIAVYVPPYEDRSYCLREYEAMERLEAVRKAHLNRPELRDKGMIIPVVFRGLPDNLPAKITQRYTYYNLSKFAPKAQSLLGNKKYASEIDEIAQTIAELYKAVKNTDMCSDCDGFTLPATAEIKPWRETLPPEPQFPR